MTTIGDLYRGGERIATLNLDGVWAADEPAVAAYLNAAFDPRHPETGDHHLPFGVMAMNRASQATGSAVVPSAPIPTLPTGAVS